MGVYEKIKKTLEQEDACVISKGNVPQYVTMKWETYQKLCEQKEDAEKAKRDERNEEYDIDINAIPI